MGWGVQGSTIKGLLTVARQGELGDTHGFSVEREPAALSTGGMSGDMGILMDTREFLWIHRNSHGCTGILMETREFSWICGNSCGYAGILMDTWEFSWIRGNSYGYAGILMDRREFS